MKALVYRKYGTADVLRFADIDKPVPQADEVLIKICATSVNRTDNATIQGIPFFARVVTGILRPRKQTPGSEFSGVIESVGANVTSLNKGDKVFGFDDTGAKAHAEYTVVKEDHVISMPEKLTFVQAAACAEGMHYAYNLINKIDINGIDSALVNGATGAIGSAAVQLLKYFNIDVSAVCATEHVDKIKALGADHVFDYRKEDFTKSERRFDFVIDAVGKSSFFKCLRLLNPRGVYVSTDLGYMGQNIFLPLITPLIKPFIGMRKTVTPIPFDIHRSLVLIKRMIEQGKFMPLLDRTYPFSDIVDAYKYVALGQKIGNVVVTLDANGEK